MKKQVFYRCLNIPGTKERWINKQYTSTHSSPPDDWYSKWKLTGSKDPSDYPLKCDVTLYHGMEYYSLFTKQAAEHFIYCIQKYESAQIWEPLDLVKASELDGVCAFDNPEEVLNYGILANDFVVFEGEITCPIPESDDGGYCVKVINPISHIMTRDEFNRNYVRHS